MLVIDSNLPTAARERLVDHIGELVVDLTDAAEREPA